MYPTNSQSPSDPCACSVNMFEIGMFRADGTMLPFAIALIAGARPQIWLPYSDVCTNCPSPVRSRATSPLAIAKAKIIPPVWSGSGAATFAYGLTPFSPRTPFGHIPPPAAPATDAHDVAFARGPFGPNPLALAYTNRGFRCLSSSHPNPSRSITPGLKFSVTTSTRATSSYTSARPSSDRKSTAMLRFPR